MNIIKHKSFEQLRLGNFAEEYTRISEWEFMGDLWIGDSIGFTEWLRPINHSSQTMSIALDLEHLNPETSWRIFESLGLEIEKGMTEKEIYEEFGNKFISERFANGRVTLLYLIGVLETEYYISLTIDRKKGLVYFLMMNHAKTVNELKIKMNTKPNI